MSDQNEKELRDAAEEGNIRDVERLLDTNVDPSCRDPEVSPRPSSRHVMKLRDPLRPSPVVGTLCLFQTNWTPLFFATRNGHTDVAAALVTARANVDAKSTSVSSSRVRCPLPLQ